MGRKTRNPQKRLLKIIRNLSMYDGCKWCNDDLDKLEQQIKKLETDAYENRLSKMKSIVIHLNKSHSNCWEWHIDVEKLESD